MDPGTIIELPDGRIGTIVFHGLTGDGIIWGEHKLTEDELAYLYGTTADLFAQTVKPDYSHLTVKAMLRKPELAKSLEIECVGEEFEIIT